MSRDFIPALRVQKELQTQVSPVYLVLGGDTYLQEYVAKVFAGSADLGAREFNLARFTELELGRCLDTARTLPMMASRRLVILDGVSRLSEEGWENLYAYLQDPNARTILLLLADRLHDARVKKIARTASVISASSPAPAEARALVQKSFQREGYGLESGVAEELVEHTGTAMQGLVQEVEKLKLYRCQEKYVSVQDVVALSPRIRPHEIFDLTDQIAARNRKELLLLLHRMLETGAVPLVLVKTIYSHFAGLLVVKELTGESETETARISGMNPYHIRRLAGQARKFGLSELKLALREAHRTDSAMKGSGLPDRLLLESLLIRIAARPG